MAADGSVNFNYDGEFGRLEGRIYGTRLTGRFVEDNGSHGEIVLTLGRENRTFTGQWRRTDIDDDYWHGCEGWRRLEEEARPRSRRRRGGVLVLGRFVGHVDRRHGPPRRGRAVKGGYDGTFGRIEAKASGPKLAGRFDEDKASGANSFSPSIRRTGVQRPWRRLNVENDDWHEFEGRRPAEDRLKEARPA